MIYDYRKGDLSPKLRALCDYAVEATLNPHSLSEKNVGQLRDVGWSDAEIHMATQVIGYFNYINRVASGLGVDLEPWMTIPEDQWLAEKAKFSKS